MWPRSTPVADGLRAPVEAIECFLAELEPPARILVAVSGGSDSLGLLIALAHRVRAMEPDRVQLIAATIDHALRPGSADEARAVADLCSSLSIPHVTRRWEGHKPSTGLSAAARDKRYDLLSDIADEQRASVIVTGHTLDDLIETVEMRAARAGGGEGIGAAGMAPFVRLGRGHWLARPLLSSRRSAIRDLVSQHGVRWFDDPSNADPRFERARLRRHLDLDDMEAQQRLLAIAAAGRRRVLLGEAAADLIDRHVDVDHGVLARCEREMFTQDDAAWRHATGLLAAVLGGRTHAPAPGALDRLADMVIGGNTGRLTVGRVVFDLRRDALWLVRENRNLPVLDVPAGGAIVWDGRFHICNRSAAARRIAARLPDSDAARSAFAGRPAGLAGLAWRVQPDVVATEGQDVEGVQITPVLSPYKKFLPQFDLKLAVSLALKLGLRDFPL